MSIDEAAAVFDAMGTSRAIRCYRPDPVPRHLLERLVWAGTRAPNPRNCQPWEFVVVTDAALRAQIGALLEPRAVEIERAAETQRTQQDRKMFLSAARLLRSFAVAPAIIFVCTRSIDFGAPFRGEEPVLSAVHGAAANIVVAARALGLGTAFTTFHLHAEDELRHLLALPDDVRFGVTMPVGWPEGGEGPVNRRPVAEVLHWDRFS